MMTQPRQSVYLLGDSKPVLSRFQPLIEAFECRGEFIVSSQAEWLSCYKQDSQNLYSMVPILIFKPSHIQWLGPFLKSCSALHIPVRVRCGATGVVGGAVVGQGGVLVLTSHLKAILDYDFKKGILTVEPGVTISDLQNFLIDSPWDIPLEMATKGVAGLAGCISSNSRGYHQGPFFSMRRLVKSVTLVDGAGESFEVPASLICGTEGILGVIEKITLQLFAKQEAKQSFAITSSWEKVLSNRSLIRSLSSLRSFYWDEVKKVFYGILEGEKWRLEGLKEILARSFPNELEWGEEQPVFLSPLKGMTAFISSACPLQEMPALLSSLQEIAHHLQLGYAVVTNLLDSSIHIHLSACISPLDFHNRIQEFLLLWVHVLEAKQGALISRHGVGYVLRPFLPPFQREEDSRFLKSLAKLFDPEQLFSGQHFFTSDKHCLVKKHLSV